MSTFELAGKDGWGSPLSKHASNCSRPFFTPALCSDGGRGTYLETLPTKGFFRAPLVDDVGLSSSLLLQQTVAIMT